MAADEKSAKLYYSMGEVAELLDVKPSLVRFWEQKFDIVKPKKNKKGNRMFTPADVQNLKMIYHLVKERGMTLAGAQKHMKARRTDIERDMELVERLQSIRSMLAEVRDHLGADGTLIENDLDEPASVQTAGYEPVVDAETEKVIDEFISEHEDDDAEPDIEDAAEIQAIIDEAHEEEVIDALMDDVIDELYDEAEDMPDFDASAVFEHEPEPEEEKPEPPKPTYIEQTLF